MIYTSEPALVYQSVSVSKDTVMITKCLRALYKFYDIVQLEENSLD